MQGAVWLACGSLLNAACEARFGARCGVAVDNPKASRAVEESLCLDPLRLDGVAIARLDRLVKSTDRGAERRSAHAVARPPTGILAHSFLGRLDDRHFLEKVP